MRAIHAALLVAAFMLAGCGSSQEPTPAAPEPSGSDPQVTVGCRLVDEDARPVTDGTCRFGGAPVPVDSDGVAEVAVASGTLVTIVAEAPGRAAQEKAVQAWQPTRVTFTLSNAAWPGSGSEPDPTPEPVVEEPPVPDEPVPAPPLPRWGSPVEVTDSGNEPHLVVAPSGTVFYAPTAGLGGGLLRSRDGGATWQDVEPGPTEAVPTLAGDTAVQVAPDGSVWYARYWAYPGTTIGCTSTDEGDTWTCDNLAIPPVTDRMWIAGTDALHGYLQTNVGLYANTYAETTTGSLKYTPHGTSSHVINVRNGNMVYDETLGHVYQVMHSGTVRLLTVDAGPGLIAARDTGIPAPYALPWIDSHDGVLWTTGEAERGGSRHLLLARSTDGGATWDTFPIQSAAQSVTFSYVAAGPDGRVAAVYYGSDAPGPSVDNGGTWSLYAVETQNSGDAAPVWVETRLVDAVHVGNICIGLNCEDSGDDPQARFSGDLIGIAMDADGLAHIAYNDDQSGGALNRFIRQHAADPLP